MSAIITGSCVDCGCDLVPSNRWARFPEAYRRALTIHAIRRHMARSLCDLCYRHRLADDTVIDIERRTLSRDELLDEWHHFTKDRATFTKNVKAFAEYLGRDFKAVQKALTRAGIGADRLYGESA